MIFNVGGVSYSVDKKLTKIWEVNSLEKLKKRNSDKNYIIDGRERVGKSLFAIQQMGVIEPEIFNDTETFLSRICFTAEQFNKAAREIKNGVVLFDEAFRGLSSRAALSKVNKMIVQTLMEMGQNNNTTFIALPSIFLLDIYPAMLRSDMLFHIKEDVKRRNCRTFKIYNRADKNVIYQLGIRKGWKYSISSKFSGRFFNKFPGGEKFEQAYLKKKMEVFTDESKYSQKIDETTYKYKIQRSKLIKFIYEHPELYNNKKKSHVKTSILLKEVGVDMSSSQISRILIEENEQKPAEQPPTPL